MQCLDLCNIIFRNYLILVNYYVPIEYYIIFLYSFVYYFMSPFHICVSVYIYNMRIRVYNVYIHINLGTLLGIYLRLRLSKSILKHVLITWSIITNWSAIHCVYALQYVCIVYIVHKCTVLCIYIVPCIILTIWCEYNIVYDLICSMYYSLRNGHP